MKRLASHARRTAPLLAILLGLLPTLVQAAPPQQSGDSGWGALTDWVAAWFNQLFIEGLKALATVCWFLEQIAAGITRFLINEDMWSRILNALLGTLKAEMPEILHNLLFSTNGAGGLMYLALMLAGIFMILPQLGSVRLVEASRVVLWGMIVVALFASTSVAGYDLIGLLEQMRAGAVQVVLSAAGETASLDDLVAQPMMASDEELAAYHFQLPEDFQEEYFPEEREYETQSVTFIDSPFFVWRMGFEVETEESQRERREKAQTGLAIAALTLVPGWVLLSFGLVFATLTAAALVLIVFFLVALPLGFFEFGAPILTGIVKQYAYLFAITLLATILPGLLISAEALAYPDGDAPDPGALMAFIPILVVVAIATQYVVGMAWNAMTGTFGIVSASIRSSMAPLAYVGAPPEAGGIPGATAARNTTDFLATTALAAATGGTSAALLAGAGTLLAGTSQNAGRAAAAVATATGGENAQLFASAARSRSGLDRAASVVITTSRLGTAHRQARERAYERGLSDEARPTSPDWHPMDAAAYQTTDPRALIEAERAHQADEHVTARRHLEAAFGSRALADEVLAVYAGEGARGQARVRRVVATTRTVASDLTSAGETLFTRAGTPTTGYQQALQTALEEEGLLATPAQATLAGRLAGASVRQPVGIWATPNGARRLAQATLTPETSEVETDDLAAQYQLQRLAQRHGWTEDQLTTLFQTVRQVQDAPPQGRSVAEETAQRLAGRTGFQHSPPAVRQEAARVATLVAEHAWTAPAGQLDLQPAPTPRYLAQAILTADPTSDPTAPQARLQALATEAGINEAHLEALFEAVRQAQAVTLGTRRGTGGELLRFLDTQGEWQQLPEPTRQEAGRLALLIAEQAQAEQRASATSETLESVPPTQTRPTGDQAGPGTPTTHPQTETPGPHPGTGTEPRDTSQQIATPAPDAEATERGQPAPTTPPATQQPAERPASAREQAQAILAAPADAETPARRLRDLAVQANWGEGQLEALFEVAQQAQATTGADRRGLEATLLRALAQRPEWQQTPLPARREASQLALQVIQQRQHKPAPVPQEEQPPTIQPTPPNDSTTERGPS
jgi:hypothetical protein